MGVEYLPNSSTGRDRTSELQQKSRASSPKRKREDVGREGNSVMEQLWVGVCMY